MKTAKFENKKRAILLSLLVVGLLLSLLNSPSASAADFIQKTDARCPIKNITLVPVGDRIEISDIIISANQDQQVTIKFTPGGRTIVSSFVQGFDTVVINFNQGVESADEQALKMDCAGTADTTVSVTVVGSSVGF
jgi:hypothetical protein